MGSNRGLIVRSLAALAVFGVLGMSDSHLKKSAADTQAVSLASESASDGDGIPDRWKVNGVHVTMADGRQMLLDLPKLGVKRGEKDVIVFVGWMEGFDGHSHKPIAGPGEHQPLGRAYDAFERIVTADGKQNVKLILIFADQAIKEHLDNKLMQLGTTTDDGTIYDWSAFDGLKQRCFYKGPPGIETVIHFCLFAHKLGGVDMGSYSGIAREMPGKDFIVSLGSVADRSSFADQQVGTFLHELGHDLGLHHGGGDDLNGKPNYPSVMNYLFQLIGTVYDGLPGNYTYSNIDVKLDEHALIDKDGISQDSAYAKYGSLLACPEALLIGSYNDPIHWDCKDDSDAFGTNPRKLDITGDRKITELPGYNDWKHLAFDTRSLDPGVKVLPTSEPNLQNVARQAGVFAPSNFRAVQRAAAIELTWGKVPLQAVRGYAIFRTAPSGRSYELIGSTSASIYVDSMVQRSMTYVYTVRSVLEDEFSRDRVIKSTFPTQYSTGSDGSTGGGQLPRLIDPVNSFGFAGGVTSEEPSAVRFPIFGKPSQPVSVTLK